MKYCKAALSAVLVALLLTACGPQFHSVMYNTSLSQVERPTDTEERYGDYTVTEQDTSEGTKYIYEDELIRASFFVVGGFMTTSIQNKTEHSIKINIGDGAFVDPSGSSDALITGEMSYSNRNQEVQPVIIPSGASSETTLIPKSNVSFNQYTGVDVSPIAGPSTIETDVAPVQQAVGKNFRLLLPFEIQGNVNEYTFSFEVLGARINGFKEDGNDVTYGEAPPAL